jgi:hypothetical protein
MTTDPTAAESPVWGAPEATPRRWGLRETATAVGVAAVIAGLGGAAIYAATDSGSHPMGGPHQVAGPGGMPGGPPGIGVHGPGPDSVGATSLHGEFVVPGVGGYTTVLTQTGTVTAVSPTSITVRSDDGYTQRYVVPPNPGGATPPFAVDDPVTIRATRTADTATVTNISNPQLGGPPGVPAPPN